MTGWKTWKISILLKRVTITITLLFTLNLTFHIISKPFAIIRTAVLAHHNHSLDEIPTQSLPKLKVLVAVVHSYGNFGNEMETTPLLHQIALWKPALFDVQVMNPYTSDIRIHSGIALRMFSGVDNIFLSTSEINITKYNVVIHAPGPFFLLTPVIRDACNFNIPIYIFGITLESRKGSMNEKSWLFLERPCVKLLALRESISYTAAHSKPSLLRLPKLLSYDLSFSFPLNEVIFRAYKKQRCSQLRKKTTLIIHRQNNPDQMIHSPNGDIFVNISSPIAPVRRVKLNASDVVFADYGWINPSSKIIYCSSVEELWSTIACAGILLTDRYHPAIAAKRLGTPLEIIRYAAEETKLFGIQMQQDYSLNDLIRHNNVSFIHLHRMLSQESMLASSIY